MMLGVHVKRDKTHIKIQLFRTMFDNVTLFDGEL